MNGAQSIGKAGPSWILGILTVVLALSYVDRYLLAILIQPVKAELGLSDGQIGVLTGLAFSLFYATIGLPLARYADRGHRRGVVGGSIVVWSLVTAMTGAVTSFAQLALARFAVGAGEAGVFPTGQALIAEHFPARRRTSAMAIFASGGSIGLLIAFAVGGLLEARFGWRMTFVLMALPALVVAPLAMFILPRDKPAVAPELKRNVWAEIRALWANPHVRQLPFAQAAVVILLFAQAQWLPAFFERSFAIPRASIGAALGLTIGLSTIAGAILGGFLADVLRKRGQGAPILLAIASIVTSVPFVLILYLGADVRFAILLVGIISILCSIPTGPIAAHLQFVVEPHQRALAAAWAVMVASLLGGGLGPVAIGFTSDLLAARMGADSLRLALLAVMLVAIGWALWHLAAVVVRLSKEHEFASPQPA